MLTGTVSIPFKRERLSELADPDLETISGYRFQFPSNGKGFPNFGGRANMLFNRYGFQFPSNGKGFPNLAEHPTIETLVHEGFNSLQTGKAFRTGNGIEGVKVTTMFQFPSNGKGFPNYIC